MKALLMRSKLLPIALIDRNKPLPLSFAQQRLWFLAQMEGVSEAYHIPFRLRFGGDLDTAALRRALNRMLSRHEALRTTFVLLGEEPVQQIASVEESHFVLLEQDLRGQDAVEAELRRVAELEARTPFDLAHGPLIRGRLIRVSEDEHVLLITMHHIVSDGWSMGIFLRELSTLYSAFMRGEDDPLPELALQYADYAVWQREWMAGEVLREQAEYWKSTLDGAPVLLELPIDHPRPAQMNYAGAVAGLVLEKELTTALKALSKRHGTTLYMTLLTAWAVLLARLSGQQDIVVGTPVANRGRVEIEPLIGFFVNTLALRIDLTGSPTVGEMLGRVRAQALSAQQHQDIPFEQVVEILRPARSVSHSPLFQVMFAWQNAEPEALDLAGLEQKPSPGTPQTVSKFDLTLALQETGERIVGGLEYATSLFEASTIERYLGHFRTLIEAMVANETQAIDRLTLLSASERHRIVYEWNETGTEYPSEKCVHELFEEQVEQTPGAIAIVYEEAELSYGELNIRANRLAHHLRELGVKPDDRVAICVERGFEMIVALLAILKAGGAYVPLDPAYPSDRLRFMLEDSAPVALLTQAHLAELFSETTGILPVVDLNAPTLWGRQPETNPDPAAIGLTAHHLAYVIYTSGSTGTPKGVMVQHGNVTRLFAATARWFHFSRNDVWAHFHSYAFDFSVWEIWGALLYAGRLVLVPKEVTRSPSEFFSLICQKKITILNQTPSSFRQLIAAQAQSVESHQLRQVVFGGEALDVAVLKPWYEQNKGNHTQLINMYGITETTVHVTYRPLDWTDTERIGSSPIGCRISDLKVYILDGHGEPVPEGVSGELYIGGAGVARGYLNRPALTAEKFVTDPFADDPKARMYRTGDLGRWRPDGNIEFLGRNDFQVKIRGFRIELGEIEARLMAHPGIRDAVVIAREDMPGDKRLVAYYTSAETSDPIEDTLNAEGLRSHLTATLPEYMVPAAYVHLERLPLTPNGKLDRKALPAPDSDAYATRGYEAPLGETESILAAIWSDLLRVERVGRHDNFFELGGHSLLAIALMERMRRSGLHMDVRAIFVTPTLMDLAETVSTGGKSVDIPPSLIPQGCEFITPEMLPLVELTAGNIEQIVGGVEGGAGNVQDIYPLAPLQEGMLFHHLMAEEGDPYLLVSQASFDTRERLDSYLMAKQAVVDRHDILRTAILWEGLSEPVQVVWREAVLSVEEVALNPAEGDIAKQLYARFDPRHHRMDIRQAPLLRVYVAQDPGNHRWVMMLMHHHLTCDHTTMEVMQSEIEAHLLGQQEELAEPLPFRNFVAQTRLGISREEHESFFRKMLGSVDEPTVPFGLVDVQGDGREIKEAGVMLGKDLSGHMRERARKLEVSAASLCHLAWAQVLGRVSGREDVVFGTVLFGRMQGGEGADRVMGPFINTLPVRIRVGEEGVETSVRRTHEALAELIRHEHASLALAQRCSAVPAPAPLFSALLNYRHNSAASQVVSKEALRVRDGVQWLRSEERTNYPFTLSVDDFGDDFRLIAQVDASIDPMRVCEYMRTALEVLVAALAVSPSAALRTLDVMPASERHRIVYEWNETGTEYPSKKCVHELFEEQVEQTPGAIAIVYEEAKLSYGELNIRANRLAHHLRELGVKPDDRVAICVERGFEMIVALLAILKAGGAYVPLDPAYPSDRLRFMLEDSAPVALLTQAHLAELFSETTGILPVVDLNAPTLWGRQPETNPDPAAIGLTAHHLAYVIYTSGSTGTPKGVMVQHGGVVNHIEWQCKTFRFSFNDSILQRTPISFDASVWEVWTPLAIGARLFFLSVDAGRDPDVIVQFIKYNKITIVQFIPSLLQAVIAKLAQAELVDLRYIFCGGEALNVALVRECGLIVSEGLINLYGPTEATIDVTTWRCVPDLVSGRIPIGRPIANTQIYILDGHGEPVPEGVSGELYIGGAGVARGYLNRPALTAEKFVTDPFADDPKARMYRTGDLGRWLPDGNIEFLGRNDFQVKIRGFRIELGEIEARLMAHPGIRDAVVIAREDVPGDKRLVAYYASAETSDPIEDTLNAEGLRSHLTATLPEYMVPAAYVHLERLPLTPNGKLDRKALPAPDSDAYATRGYEAPLGETESILAAIWSDLLRVEQVGRHDNFFELGGHSLLAVRVISQLRQVLGIEVALNHLFTYPVLADFARSLENAALAELPPITRIDRDQRLPLSFAQQRLWFLAQMEGVSEAYHIPFRLRFGGDLDTAALRRALNRMLSRHEALRTTFVLLGEEPVQQIASVEESHFVLLQQDLRGQDAVEAELRRVAELEARTPFDLAHGPLIRGRLIRVSEDEHVLLITMHHIVSDGWSMGIFLRELSTLYSAFMRGEDDPLPELALQYADYAVWQREWMAGEVLREQAEYWKSTLDGAPVLLELPIDHPRPAQMNYAGAVAGLVLEKELTTALKALSKRHGTTLYMTLLTAWAVLLARLSGQQDIVVGTPVANRGRVEIEPLIGFFVNTLALRIDLTGSPTVGEMLGRVRAQALSAQQHQDIPFEQVVEILRPARSVSHSPLFQVMFAWQNAEPEALDLAGLEQKPSPGTPQTVSKFDLTLALQETGERIVGGLEYATSLFEASTIERYLGHFRTLIEAMVANETQAIDRLTLLSASERHRIVYEWNETGTEYPSKKCVHELFEEQVEQTPGAIAIVYEEAELSYGELNIRANRLAHHLRELGVKPDDRVAICVERGFEMIVALLAILKAGGAYVPLDPAYPSDRLRFMLEDSAPVALLTQAHLAELFSETTGILPVVDLNAPTLWGRQPETNPDPAAIGLTAHHLAYVIYTSGSTGTPKGVMVQHGNVTRLVCNTNYINFQTKDVIAQASNTSFDAATFEIWGALLNGSRLVILDQDVLLESLRFRQALRKYSVAILWLPVGLFNQYAVSMAEEFAALRYLVIGGDVLNVSSVSRFLKSHSPDHLINGYGPTETTTFAATHEIACVAESNKSIPIGRPIANTRIYILDGHGEPVPEGVSGELYIGGAGVARGYLNRPALTAEKFVTDPFADDPKARMYRTGDLGRWRPDGNIEFLGRNDFQVKIRGFRIELGEIEARLMAHPGIRDAVVIAREDVPGDKRLVAYYTSAETSDPIEDTLNAEGLRSHLTATLPEYMVPAAYVHLERLPLTPNGKLDRKALPAPDSDAYATRGYEAPLGETESILAAIWSDLLRVEQVGRHDDFFELGGHSLLVVQVMTRLQRGLSVDIALGEFYAYPVLADLARSLENAALAELPPITRIDRDQRLPLSFAQQRLWFLAQMEGVSEAYHIPFRLRFGGDLDTAALRRALNRMLSRHEALRTTFVLLGEEPVQQIASVEESHFVLLQQDLRGQDAVEAELRRGAELEARTPFDLAHGPLIRGRLIRVSEDEHVLLITMHHIVSDGWSMGIFLRELSTLYSAFMRGENDPLPELALQYADYAVWQREWMAGEVLREQAEYWKSTLDGAPVLLELPTDHPRPAQMNYAGAVAGLVLEKELTTALKALSKRHGTTLYMTLLTAWAVLLARLSGQQDIVVGTPVANRGRVEIEPLIGFFVNTLALRIDLTGSPTVGEMLGRVRAQALSAQQHQDIPFEQVVEILRPARSVSHSPLFQVMFAWQNAEPEALDLAGLEQKPSPGTPQTVSKFDLTLALQETGERIVGGLEYATSLFEASTIERYLGHFRTLIEAMVANETQAIDRLTLLSASERHRIVYEWNETGTEYPSEKCVHELFEEQVEQTPGAIAIVYEEAELSYGELNIRANRLAHHLRELGVKPDDRVAICVERGFEMIVALLAILKAGGAYVPLDPAYPSDRLRFMLEDSAPVALLTQAHLAELFSETTGILPVVDLNAPTLWGRQPETNPDPAAIGLTAHHLAYVIYTSGSTGTPKGVAVEHRNVLNYLHWTLKAYAPMKGSIISSSLSFDATVTSMYGPLLCGGAARFLPEHQEIDHLNLQITNAKDYEIVKIAPSHFDVIGRAAHLKKESTSIGLVIIGGEVLSASTVRLWREIQPDIHLVNEYGPTETVVGCVVYKVPNELDELKAIPIGRPIANTQIYILDGYGEPVPEGVSGELYIGGAGVARGYLNRPALTAEKFVTDPFADDPKARMYRTGDLGRWLRDGNIEFLGRNDFQVKIRGFRIELGEIEARLMAHPRIRDAVVIAREDVPGDKRLVAYYASAETSDPIEDTLNAEGLRSHLTATLPEYMVPAAYVHLERLPLTPNGKLDRKALPAPDSDAYATRGYKAPLGETESILAAIWSDLLRVEQVGRHDDFFELGGHSLLAVRVISQLRQVLGIEVALNHLFTYPVLADFARSLENAALAELPPITRIDRDQRLPLSFAQQRLWFLAQMEGVSEAYHIPFRLRFGGDLDTAALRRALNRMLSRHEALRTTFVLLGEEPVQQIASVEESHFVLLQQDLRGQDAVEAELRRVAELEARTPFDLAHGPLIRGRLIRVSEDEHVLLITMHHIVSDGWSMGIFLRELSTLYSAFMRGEDDPLPELAFQYADYAVWQREWMAGEVLREQAEYWKSTLDGAPVLLELPTDHPRPAQMNYAGAVAGLVLEKELTTALKALSKRHGTTLYMTLLTAWAVLLARLSGQQDIVVGTPVANRGRVEIEPLIGFFVNTLALRIDLTGSPTVGEMLGRVRAQALSAQQHQDIPFEQVVEILRPARSVSHSPLFQVMFAWQNAEPEALDLAGLEQKPSPGTPQTVSKFDLTLALQETGERIVGGLEYATSLFEASTIERYLGHFRTLIEAMVANETQAIDRLTLLSASERHRIVYEWNETGTEYPSEKCVHELFEEQVEQTPGAIAIVYEEVELSYGELNIRANRLAHHLRELGVKPDDRVAICVERGFEMIVALLAILKAGGAYVPLDPAYPSDRLRFMLEDSAPVALLTQAHLAELFSETTGILPVVDLNAPTLWGRQPETNPDPAAIGLTAHHLAYVIYTSGSTGTPKGVAVEHRNTLNLLYWAKLSFPFHILQRTLFSTSLNFDLSVYECFAPIVSGAAIRVVPNVLDLARTQRDITHINTVPSAIRALSDLEGIPSTVRTINLAGEPLKTTLVNHIFVTTNVEAICNLYGPSETTTYSTWLEMRRGERFDICIGRPIANTQIYILDGHGEPVPEGVSGELYIGGAGVARGYLNRPALTAEKFVTDPFADDPKARMYRTGDLGRWLPDGNIEFLGRNDFQVKIRGFRIELGEIEARLMAHPGIRDAVVIAREDVPGDKRLVAYYASAETSDPIEDTLNAEGLRSHLTATLPEYMVPAAYVHLERLPLTSNGKLDRKALPAPDSDVCAPRGYEAPLGETESILAAIWSEVLRVEQVGRHDDFFELGGHSLLVVQVTTRLRHALGVEIALNQLFAYPMLADLAEHIIGAQLEQFHARDLAIALRLMRSSSS